jgi:CDP-diacylglycerol--glycerol-3-phosphate 3-phosphatidyltransferase
MTMDTGFGPSALATPANGITIARLAATPLLLYVVLRSSPSYGAFVFWFLLSCTDGVDGWLARRQGTTRSGAFLDPLADKFVVLGAMAALVATGQFWWLPVSLIAIREVGISAYRASVGRHGVSVPARPLAKAKTVVQDLAVGFAVMPAVGTRHPGFATGWLWAAVVLTVWSGALYLIDGAKTATSGTVDAM